MSDTVREPPVQPPLLRDDLDERLRIRRETDWLVLWLALGVLVAALTLRVTPDQAGVSLFGLRLPELCAAKRLGGTCPGCGLTRSFTLGAKLDARAFELHPLGPLLLIAVVVQLPYRGFHLLRTRRLLTEGRREDALRRRSWPMFGLVGGLLILLCAIWVVRTWL